MAKFVTAKQLAEILDITERHVNRLYKEKDIFIRDIDGKFDVVRSVANYYKEKFNPDDPQKTYDQERALHERAKREKAELLLGKLQNRLHDARDIEIVLTTMLVTFRNRMLGIPATLAPKLIGRKTIAEINNLLQVAIREALTELSEYDPKMFATDIEDDYGTEDDQPISKDS